MWWLLKRAVCAVIGHDRDMEFLDAHTLDWQFKCKRCGHITTDPECEE